MTPDTSATSARDLFADVLMSGADGAGAELIGDGGREDSLLVALLFQAGCGVGLTDKEIVHALLRPVRAQLRPGLKRL